MDKLVVTDNLVTHCKVNSFKGSSRTETFSSDFTLFTVAIRNLKSANLVDIIFLL